MPASWIVGVVLALLACHVLKKLLIDLRPQRALPPGPRKLPLVGNITDMPPAGGQDWLHWAKHKNLYGPISSVTVLGQPIVIINDLKIAVELLNRRSAIHSSRPNMIFASEMVGWESSLAMQGSTDRFRAYRKAIQPSFGSESGVSQFNAVQEKEVRRFLLRILRKPDEFLEHILTEAGAVILSAAYGYTIEPFERDNLVHMSNVALDRFAQAATPGKWMVDLIPMLRYIPTWFPGAQFKRTAKAWRNQISSLADVPYAFSKAQVKNGTSKPSYLASFFSAHGIPEPGTEAEAVAKWTAASLYAGGADTTVSSIECFILAMALYPEVQAKAQEEIERVVGPKSLPTLADRSRLPYLNAVVKEVLRWHPVAPMALPHMSVKDDTWENFFLPKGSLILANIWAMMHDPATYHDPMTFKPERFLPSEGHTPETDPHTIAFGFGRRICPGRFLADNTVFLTVAQTLAVFDIRNAVQDGVPASNPPKFQAGMVSQPVPFQCSIKVRSPSHEALVLSVEQEHPWEPSDAPAVKNLNY
ncbi:O-methylsterigmatocystin oxidoreductase [Penicillium oxalicum]|uniref:O-methylsterigmatocystin oxidoreductase n=1 Tax=Penicillium oxalicum TaxID=69781 RepID=UPI0020B6EBEF|nr:O-methylsterigmatocystin oxidoreductase [Penicillium oxalicum]KAI2787985.1 O-methylsterigmatocystin oxidoreductase [Penicillium oxalicum]